MEYFYAPPDCLSGDTLRIEGEEFAHLTHVMRKAKGDTVMVVDGAGRAYEAVVGETSGHRALCTVLAVHQRLHEPERAVHLGVAVVKNTSNFDFLVEKCTELGVRSITPLLTARTIPRHARPERWQKIALAAMKQSGRCLLPAIRPLTPLGEFLRQAAAGIRLMPHEKTDGPALTGAMQHVAGDAVITLCIGPEGGFAEEEVREAMVQGFQPVRLGCTRLRTETAAIVATAACIESPPER